MKLENFDEKNAVHGEAFDYFAFVAGHPRYLVDSDDLNNIEDMDLGFREFLQAELGLDEMFIDDCNGSFHEFISRNQDNIKLKVFFGWIDREEIDQELIIEVSGKLFYLTPNDEVIFVPDIKSIKVLENTWETMGR